MNINNENKRKNKLLCWVLRNLGGKPTSWDYRVAKRKNRHGNDVYVIHEVYFNEDRSISNISYEPHLLTGIDIEDLKGTLEYMIEAFEHPLVELPEEIYNEPVDANVYQILDAQGDKEESAE
jgi:hypothetical protein